MKSSRAGELLEDLEDRGYPVDYLCARVRGRRSRLTTDWRTLAYEAFPPGPPGAGAVRGGEVERSAGGGWPGLLREHRWVYARMNAGLRALFAHYFLYAELRTLCIVLRHMGKGGPGEADGLLSASILSRKIKEVLRSGGKPEYAVVFLERTFRGLSDGFTGLAAALKEGGRRGFEEMLTNRYLAHVAGRRLHPLIRSFFARVIDARNVLALLKTVRFGGERNPVFLDGGCMAGERYRAVLRSGDLPAAGALVRETTGIRTASHDITKAESALYRGITKWLRKEGRDPLGAGLLLDYLWRCSLETVNMSVLSRTRDFDRETVLDELVY